MGCKQSFLINKKNITCCIKPLSFLSDLFIYLWFMNQSNEEDDKSTGKRATLLIELLEAITAIDFLVASHHVQLLEYIPWNHGYCPVKLIKITLDLSFFIKRSTN